MTAHHADIVGVDLAASIADHTTVVRGRLRPDGVLVITSMERIPGSEAVCARCGGIIAQRAMLAPLRECCRAAKTTPCGVCLCCCKPRGKARRIAR